MYNQRLGGRGEQNLADKVEDEMSVFGGEYRYYLALFANHLYDTHKVYLCIPLRSLYSVKFER